MCIFCDIAAGRQAARIAAQDDEVVAFHDIDPQAPTHLLVIPRRHVAALRDASDEDQRLLGRLLLMARRVALETGLQETGYRVVINDGRRAGQSVFHLHVHVLGGRSMRWPPG